MDTSQGDLVAAIDQGTSNSKLLVLNSKNGEIVTSHNTEVKTIYPKEGWAEHDPTATMMAVHECIRIAVDNLKNRNIDPASIKAIGITNHRESTVAWDKFTGLPLYNAILWLDIRTASTVNDILSKIPNHDKDHLRPLCGLPISTYFSALKMKWLLDNCAEVRGAVNQKRCLFGTIDSWIIWNLSGGKNGGRHVTDVTNASRTMLMNLRTLDWDQKLCNFFGIPRDVLPEICSSSEIYTRISDGPLKGVPISGILGDQQAALVGQQCFNKGDAKNTYGTGCFMLYNTGTELVESNEGLLTTVAYKFGKDSKPVYALENLSLPPLTTPTVAISYLRSLASFVRIGRTMQGAFTTKAHIARAALEAGLEIPSSLVARDYHICAFTTKAHIARAALEAVCFQTRELLEAMKTDSNIKLSSLKVDGGMTVNDLLMQLQTDIVGIPVVASINEMKKKVNATIDLPKVPSHEKIIHVRR